MFNHIWHDGLYSLNNSLLLPVGSCGCGSGDPHCALICTRMTGHCGVLEAIGVAEGSLNLDRSHISELRLADAIGRRSGLQERTILQCNDVAGLFLGAKRNE